MKGLFVDRVRDQQSVNRRYQLLERGPVVIRAHLGRVEFEILNFARMRES